MVAREFFSYKKIPTLVVGLLLFSCSGIKPIEKKENSDSKATSLRQDPKKKIKRPPLILGPTKQNLSNPNFIDVTKKFGLAGVESVHNYAVDFNGDGYLDLVVLPDYFSTPRFFAFSKKDKKFIELTYRPFIKAGLFRASFLHFYDFNKDGVLDLVLSTLNQKSDLDRFPLRFFLGKKVKGNIYYEEQRVDLKYQDLPTAAVSFFDYNLDGLLDFFQANWYKNKNKVILPEPDRLFQARKAFQFQEDTGSLLTEGKWDKELNFYANATPSFGSSICDIDQNGYPDILSVSSNGYANKLWLNQYDKSKKTHFFQNYGKESGFAHDKRGELELKGGGNTFFANCIDYNNDGIMDVFMGEQNYSYDHQSVDRSSILTGAKFGPSPRFIRTEYTIDKNQSEGNQGNRRGVWIDLNFDGLADLLVDNSGFPPYSRLLFFQQNPDHSFDNLSSEGGIDIMNPSGTIVADFNKDGRPDIISGQSNLRNSKVKKGIYLFQNNIPWEGKRVIRFILKGERANAHGLGATLLLHTSKGVKKQVVDYAQGPQPSQNEEGVFFGLGNGEKVKFLEVVWPIKSNKKSSKPLVHKYKLSRLKFKRFINILLRENGSFKAI